MFKNKIGSNLIQFHAQYEKNYKVFPHPYPASEKAPEWYRKQNRYWGNEMRTKQVMENNGLINTTIKACMPVFDSMSAGYYIPLYSDIDIQANDNGHAKSIWGTQFSSVISTHHPEQYDNYPLDREVYSDYALKFENPWIIKTPPGYSCLFIHPLHYEDLPFRCASGIVDTDTYPLPVNFPFFIKKNFSGILETGTPMIQVIPFKREKWKMETGFDEESYLKWEAARSYFSNKYKRFFRSEKVWNEKK